MEAALDSQKSYWTEYGENLNKVGKAARDAGIDLGGMWDYLSGGTPEAAAAVAALAASIKSGDTSELEALIEKYDAMIEARSKATEYATEGFDEIQEKWEEVQKGGFSYDRQAAFDLRPVPAVCCIGRAAHFQNLRLLTERAAIRLNDCMIFLIVSPL